MTPQDAAGVALIAVPLLFNVGFIALSAGFDYPDILRKPAHEVLARFRAGGTDLVLTWGSALAGRVLGARRPARGFGGGAG